MIKVSEHDIHMLTSTIVVEARSEEWLGKVAVGWVIRNRYTKPGWWSREKDTVEDDTLAAVCVDAWQFSGFNVGDPNLRYAMILPRTHFIYLSCKLAALAVILETEADLTNGACHYYAKSMPSPPAWWEGQESSFETGDTPSSGHRFFNNIR